MNDSIERNCIKNALTSFVKELDENFQQEKKNSGLGTGFDKLDYKISGLQPAEIMVFAGRPGVGKSSVLINIAKNVAINSKKLCFLH